MGLDNVAVRWPATGRFYDPVAPAEFVDFVELADEPDAAAPTAALAGHIARTGSVRATAYTEVVDLLLGLRGVLYATEAAEEDEDPVIDPDGCAWVAGGLEKFVDGHASQGNMVTFETVSQLLRRTLAGSRHADKELAWLEQRLDALRDDNGGPPQWSFPLSEFAVLARFYRRCADRGFAVYAES